MAKAKRIASNPIKKPIAQKKATGVKRATALWQLAPGPGQPRRFDTPETLWKCAVEYFTWCQQNPWKKQNWVGRNAKLVYENKPIPFTWTGLAVYTGVVEQTLRNYGTLPEYSQYFGVYAEINQAIREQKFSGAANGFFNASIIARDLGLVEKTDNEQRVSGSISFIFNEAAGCDPIKNLSDFDDTTTDNKERN